MQASAVIQPSPSPSRLLIVIQRRMPANRQNSTHPRWMIPALATTWSWLNRFSLDAVWVALAWQAIFARGFLDRWASGPEMFCLAAATWLIYAADRLLDARSLDLSRPHTQRHRFHHDHAGKLAVAWGCVLVSASVVAVRHLPGDQRRTGILIVAAVLLYGASVHFVPTANVPKPWLVGFLFASGVAAVAWTMPITFPWVAATLLTGIVFGLNCHLVARSESDLDAAQSFTDRPLPPREPSAVVWILLVLGIGLTGSLTSLPGEVTWSLAATAMMMGLTRFIRPRSVELPAPPTAALRRRVIAVDMIAATMPLLGAGASQL